MAYSNAPLGAGELVVATMVSIPFIAPALHIYPPVLAVSIAIALAAE